MASCSTGCGSSLVHVLVEYFVRFINFNKMMFTRHDVVAFYTNFELPVA